MRGVAVELSILYQKSQPLWAALRDEGFGVGEAGGPELLAEFGKRLALIVDYAVSHFPSFDRAVRAMRRSFANFACSCRMMR